MMAELRCMRCDVPVGGGSLCPRCASVYDDAEQRAAVAHHAEATGRVPEVEGETVVALADHCGLVDGCVTRNPAGDDGYWFGLAVSADRDADCLRFHRSDVLRESGFGTVLIRAGARPLSIDGEPATTHETGDNPLGYPVVELVTCPACALRYDLSSYGGNDCPACYQRRRYRTVRDTLVARSRDVRRLEADVEELRAQRRRAWAKDTEPAAPAVERDPYRSAVAAALGYQFQRGPVVCVQGEEDGDV